MIKDIDEQDIIKYLPNYKNIIIPTYTYGQTLKGDIDSLIKLLLSNDTKTVFEIGTWLGMTTAILAEYFDVVYTIDIERNTTWPPKLKGTPIGSSYINSKCVNRIHQFFGDTADPSVIKSIREYIGNDVDGCFIDGSHSYGGAIMDNNNAVNMVKNGGIIIFHDVNVNTISEVRKACDDIHNTVFHINNTWNAFYINKK